MSSRIHAYALYVFELDNFPFALKVRKERRASRQSGDFWDRRTAVEFVIPRSIAKLQP
jgi:hypothetical protein